MESVISKKANLYKGRKLWRDLIAQSVCDRLEAIQRGIKKNNDEMFTALPSERAEITARIDKQYEQIKQLHEILDTL